MSRKGRYLFTSESVTEGHPDKIADQISDSILDAILAQDPAGRVACETFAITGQIHVAGEISTTTYVDIPRIVRDTIRDVGYDKSAVGFDYETCGTLISVKEQSPDIAQGENAALETRGESRPAWDLIGRGQEGFVAGAVHASFLHVHWAAFPQLAQRLVAAAGERV